MAKFSNNQQSQPEKSKRNNKNPLNEPEIKVTQGDTSSPEIHTGQNCRNHAQNGSNCKD